jgi:hypothetical protein
MVAVSKRSVNAEGFKKREMLDLEGMLTGGSNNAEQMDLIHPSGA